MMVLLVVCLSSFCSAVPEHRGQNLNLVSVLVTDNILGTMTRGTMVVIVMLG